MLMEDENLILAIDESWSDDYSIGLKGWILSKKGALETVEINIAGNRVVITSWHPRPDVTAQYPQYYSVNCGFVVHFPRIAQHKVTFNAQGQGNTYNKTVTFDGSLPQPPDPNLFPDGAGLYNQFIQLVNEDHLKVLEIGSRIVSPGSVSKRPLFHNSKFYTGFDYYPDSNTDVVGDAHKLSEYFGNQRFDAIFSLSVFEHLAMPWIVAREISKLLEVGGITFHHTHFVWPNHEQPWDFWRFCDAGLKVLFSPALGFEVIQAAYYAPMRLHFDHLQSGQETFPFYPVFGGVAILAKKVREVNYDKFRWDVTLDEILETQSHYPKP